MPRKAKNAAKVEEQANADLNGSLAQVAEEQAAAEKPAKVARRKKTAAEVTEQATKQAKRSMSKTLRSEERQAAVERDKKLGEELNADQVKFHAEREETIHKKVVEALLLMRDTGHVDLTDYMAVLDVAHENFYDDVYSWLTAHEAIYLDTVKGLPQASPSEPERATLDAEIDEKIAAVDAKLAPIPEVVLEALEAVRASGQVPMGDRQEVIQAVSAMFNAAAEDWLTVNESRYMDALHEVGLRVRERAEAQRRSDQQAADQKDAAEVDQIEADINRKADEIRQQAAKQHEADKQVNRSERIDRAEPARVNSKPMAKAMADRVILTDLGKLSIKQAKFSLKPTEFALLNTTEQMQHGMAILIANTFSWDRQVIEDTFDLALAATYKR